MRLFHLSCIILFALATTIGCATGRETDKSSGAKKPDPPHVDREEMEHEPLPLSGTISALVLVRRLDGVNQHEGGPGIVGDRFGIFAIVDDMDRDGTPDIIVGAPRADPGGTPGGNEGSVYVYSGAALLEGADLEKTLLYRVDGEMTTNGTGELGFRQTITSADFDGDGYPELALGAWRSDPVVNGETQVDAGTLFVFNGAALLKGESQEKALMFRLDGGAGSRLGRPNALVGDINRDGVPDLFVGAHRSAPGGREKAGSGYLISGADFSILHRFDGGAPNDFLGRSILSPGDLNDDGYPDLAIGSSQGDGGQAGGTPTGSGFVTVYSGKDYSPIHRLTPPADEPTGAFGQTTVYVPRPGELIDLNNDGVPEIIVGSPEARSGLPGPEGKEGFPRTGSVYVYSGADFSLLYRFKGEGASAQAGAGPAIHEDPVTGKVTTNIGDVFGDAVALIPDLDGDGVVEIMIGSPRGDGRNPDGTYPPDLINSGYAKIFSGASGKLLVRLNGFGNSTNMGHHVISVSDLTKDGHFDILVGSDLTDYGGTDAGSLYWYTITVSSPAE